MFNEIYNKIKEFDTIIIHRHTNPDGDALGSQIGLKEAILATFPNKVVKITGDMTSRYSFMGEMDEISDDIYNDALVFVLDSGSTHLINDDRFRNGKYLIKMDHHLAVEDYADINYVDISRESCAGIIAEFIKSVGMKLTQKGAEALYTGMVTDSGRFRYSSTTSTTFDSASFLMNYNPDINKIYLNLYTEDFDIIILKAKLTCKIKLTENNVAYMIHTKDDVKEYGLDIFSISRGMVNLMAGIKGVGVWVNFTEVEDGKVFVEFRSNGANVNKVAVKYGGGGHLQASGCTLEAKEYIYNVLEDLNKVVEE